MSQDSDTMSITNIDDEVITFVHISDLHLMADSHSKTSYMFKKFLGTILPNIHPNFVICSGDMTNSVDMHDSSSYQRKEEWEQYSSCLKNAHYFDPEFWLDIRGNHDEWDETGNYGIYYKEHSVYGHYNKSGVYDYHIPYKNTKLCIIGFEGCEEIQWCFFGRIPFEILESLESKLEENKDYPIILFCHFPLFTIDDSTRTSKNHNLHDLINIYKPLAYLSGHIHTVLGKKTNYLMNENTQCLTVNDFKEQGVFRLFTFRNGVLSFHDYFVDDYNSHPLATIMLPSKSKEFDKNTKYSDGYSDEIYLTIPVKSCYTLKQIQLTIDNTPITLIQNKKNDSIYYASIQSMYRSQFCFLNYICSPQLLSKTHLCQLTIEDSKENKTKIQTKLDLKLNLPIFNHNFFTYLLQFHLYKYTSAFSFLFPMFMFLISYISYIWSNSLIQTQTSISSTYLSLLNQMTSYTGNYYLGVFLSRWLVFHHDPVFISTIFIYYILYFFCPYKFKNHVNTTVLYYWWGAYNIKTHTKNNLEDNQLWSPICLCYQLFILDLFYFFFYPYTNEYAIIPLLIQILCCIPLLLLTSLFTTKRCYWENSDFLCTYSDEIRPYLSLFLCIFNITKYFMM